MVLRRQLLITALHTAPVGTMPQSSDSFSSWKDRSTRRARPAAARQLGVRVPAGVRMAPKRVRMAPKRVRVRMAPKRVRMAPKRVRMAAEGVRVVEQRQGRWKAERFLQPRTATRQQGGHQWE